MGRHSVQSLAWHCFSERGPRGPRLDRLQSLDPSVWKSLALSTTNCHSPSSIENQVWKAPKLALKSLTYLDLLIKTAQLLVHVKAIACELFLGLLALAGRVL